jgi:hypothetical protein
VDPEGPLRVEDEVGDVSGDRRIVQKDAGELALEEIGDELGVELGLHGHCHSVRQIAKHRAVGTSTGHAAQAPVYGAALSQR